MSWEASTIQVAVHDLVARLPQRLQQVITARYGLNGHQARTYRRIGARLGLKSAHQQVQQWLRRRGGRNGG